VIYTVVRKWLPGGRFGALALGIFLVVILATRADPLRSDNPDFELVGPGWLAVSVFAVLALLHAFVLVAVMARVSRSLPLFRRSGPVLLAYSPLLLLLLTTVVGAVVVLVVVAGAAVSTHPAVRHFWVHPRLVLAGRTLIAAVTLASLPSFTTAIVDIL
jgi:hypothetical protein